MVHPIRVTTDNFVFHLPHVLRCIESAEFCGIDVVTTIGPDDSTLVDLDEDVFTRLREFAAKAGLVSVTLTFFTRVDLLPTAKDYLLLPACCDEYRVSAYEFLIFPRPIDELSVSYSSSFTIDYSHIHSVYDEETLGQWVQSGISIAPLHVRSKLEAEANGASRFVVPNISAGGEDQKFVDSVCELVRQKASQTPPRSSSSTLPDDAEWSAELPGCNLYLARAVHLELTRRFKHLVVERVNMAGGRSLWEAIKFASEKGKEAYEVVIEERRAVRVESLLGFSTVWASMIARRLPLSINSASTAVAALFSQLHCPVSNMNLQNSSSNNNLNLASAAAISSSSSPIIKTPTQNNSMNNNNNLSDPYPTLCPSPSSSVNNNNNTSGQTKSSAFDFRVRLSACLPPFWDAGKLWEIAGSRANISIPTCVLSPQMPPPIPVSSRSYDASRQRFASSFLAGVAFLAARQAIPDALSWTEKNLAAGLSTVSCGKTSVARMLFPVNSGSNSSALPHANSCANLTAGSQPGRNSTSGVQTQQSSQKSMQQSIRQSCADYGLLQSLVPNEISVSPSAATIVAARLRESHNSLSTNWSGVGGTSANLTSTSSSQQFGQPSRSFVAVLAEEESMSSLVTSCYLFDGSFYGVSLNSERTLIFTEDANSLVHNSHTGNTSYNLGSNQQQSYIVNSNQPQSSHWANLHIGSNSNTTSSSAAGQHPINFSGVSPLSMGNGPTAGKGGHLKRTVLSSVELHGIGKISLETSDPCSKRASAAAAAAVSTPIVGNGSSVWGGAAATARLAAQISGSVTSGSQWNGGLLSSGLNSVNPCVKCIIALGGKDDAGGDGISGSNMTTELRLLLKLLRT